jgi:hypothetical protein
MKEGRTESLPGGISLFAVAYHKRGVPSGDSDLPKS